MFDGIIKRSQNIFENVLDVAYPPVCLYCDTFIDHSKSLICSRCWNRAVQFDYPFCSNCGEILEKELYCKECSNEYSLPVFALGHFVEPLKEIIHKFKYNDYSKLAVGLGSRILGNYAEDMKKLKIDLILPIPLHSYREKIRGFNQAAVFSDIIGRGLGVRVVHRSLLKIKRTKDQTRLNPQQREVNIKGVFRVVGDKLKGNRVMIVDDVITTGATIREAARVLIEAGVKPVAYCVVAVAGL
jgi:ComF family protein